MKLSSNLVLLVNKNTSRIKEIHHLHIQTDATLEEKHRLDEPSQIKKLTRMYSSWNIFHTMTTLIFHCPLHSLELAVSCKVQTAAMYTLNQFQLNQKF